MSLEKLFEIIDRSWLGRIVDKKRSVILETNPNRVYIENVRSFFNTSTTVAKLLCKMAVKDGYFKKKYGLVCPNCERIIKSTETLDLDNKNISCDTCEIMGEECFNYDVNRLEKVEFYQISK